MIIDEARVLTDVRQQSRLKTMPSRAELTLIFCTTNPGRLDPALHDRCAKIRLGSLSAREVPLLVKRACQLRDVPYSNEIVQALNRAECLRPRAILNAVDALARGKCIVQAVGGR